LGRRIVLDLLSDHIRLCYQRAAQAEERAANADPAETTHQLNLAKWWAHLARSYEFAESLERFLADADSARELRRDREKTHPAWQRAASAPFDRDLRLAVLDADGTAHELVFPCRRVLGGWVKSQTKERLAIDPTHWQAWDDR
jgi:hypothetical protein